MMTMTDTNVDVCGGLEATAEQLDDLLHLLLRGEGDWMMHNKKGPTSSTQRTRTSKDLGSIHWVTSGMCETSKT